jgi:NitT/TauT family transport system ATP-binding protein
MVFQSPYLLPWLSTLRNVAAGLEFRSTPKAEATQRAMEVLRLVGLEGFESHKPRQLSGGMQQRVNLARALVVEPRLLLLDEPFAALDAYTRLYMQNELTRIMEEVQCSALFVTHDITEAIYLADRVIVLKPRPGEVLADIRIEFPRPRDKSIRGEPAFGSLVAQVTDLIESSLAGAQNAHKRTD